ncbi:MAG TPA: glutamate 5-kinase, partial [Oligoflexia bacterium]|nr:glutamate 5-kinase [Oligoflexia bacterium]
MKEALSAARLRISAAHRVVVKIGTRVLASDTGRPAARRINEIVRGVAELKKSGREVIIVTSGAVGTGLDALGRKTRPGTVPELQMAAAVGQARLMSYYEKLFSQQKLKVGQVLLTYDDLNNRTRHLNARNTMMALVRNGIIPIVNENDVVAVDELAVGDNDVLAALVCVLIEADVLVLLSTVNGLYASGKDGKRERISYLPRVTREALGAAKGKGGMLSTGGMSSKLRWAQTAVSAGALAVIADGRAPAVLHSIFSGADVGTVIGSAAATGRVKQSRKKWIAFFHRARGVIVVDEGARGAVEKRGKSLLPIGIRQVRGNFKAGSFVAIEALDGRIIARGLASYSSEQLTKIKGKKSCEIAAILGRKDYDEAVHRDNMVLAE